VVACHDLLLWCQGHQRGRNKMGFRYGVFHDAASCPVGFKYGRTGYRGKFGDAQSAGDFDRW
ncbi:hypothetical protein N9B28_01650, partial [bacterium]|nr:hypothetical protein [bacterium]